MVQGTPNCYFSLHSSHTPISDLLDSNRRMDQLL
jgi:hypothetical protein